MKRTLSLSTTIGLGLLGLITPGSMAEDAPQEARVATSVFEVTGMTCSGCEVGVRRAVKKLDGVDQVEASHEAGTATVTYDPEQVTPEDIIAAIEDLGYTAELRVDEDSDA